MNALFQLGDIVQHANGNRYRIIMTPAQGLTIEKTGELAYLYHALKELQRYWVRSQTEMEDGRFALLRETADEVR